MPQVRVNQYERASRAWPTLTRTAERRTTITYAQLAAQLGIHPRPIRYVLAIIQDWCLQEKKPPLTILVVNQSGHPGQGFIAWDTDNLDEGYEQVWSFPWPQLRNPFAFADDDSTPEGLAQRVFTTPEAAAEVYRRVRERGMTQVVFRLALLHAYDQECAFCGLSLTAALRAAHIVPWDEASSAERIAPSNGLLLCSTHHDLFDAGILSVTTDCRIVCRRGELGRHRWNSADREAALALDGQAIALPREERHRPSYDSLAYLAGGRRR